MPKCVTCGDVLPPQFLTTLDGVDVDVSHCLFCKMETDKVTMPPDQFGQVLTYTKEEAKRDYQRLLMELKDKLVTRDDLKKFMKGDM